MGELGATMSSAEFSLWLAIYNKEPWDDARMDVGFAVVASTVANYAGKVRTEGHPPAALADFMPFLERPPEPEPDPMAFFGNLL